MKKMREPVLLGALQRYARSGAARFHMPGHKGKKPFTDVFPGAEWDVTELSFSGALETGEGVIAEAQAQMADVLGCRETHLVTDGSTAAILAMLWAAARAGKGNRIVIPRISHKSVYNALALFRIEPIFLPCTERDGMIFQDVSSLGKILDENPDALGALLVSPDYYGNVPDLRRARDEVKRRGKIFLIDGAHGGHLAFAAPDDYAGRYADAWVDGIHKTLPCLTQAALLNVNDEALSESVEEGLSLFRTTSPSYPIMASAEYALCYAESAGKEAFDDLAERIDDLTGALQKCGYAFYSPRDKCKLVLDCMRSNVNGKALVRYAESEGLFAEFFDGRYIVLMASAESGKEDFEKCGEVLRSFRGINREEYVDNAGKRRFFTEPTRVMEYVRAANAPWERVGKEAAAGRISAGNAGFFPPCYPIVTAGEILTREIVESLAGSAGAFGLAGGRFKVVKEEK